MMTSKLTTLDGSLLDTVSKISTKDGFLLDRTSKLPTTHEFLLYRTSKHTTLDALRKHAYSNILKLFPLKKENFQIRTSDIFHISAQNIDCGRSRAETHNLYFWAEIRKIMYTPVNPSFTI